MPRRLALAAALLAAAGAQAQQPQPSTRDLYKGKVQEGLYELRSERDLTGVPGIPKEMAKGTETQQRCLTKQDLDRGVEPGKDCTVKSYKATDKGAVIVMECKDGNVTDASYTFTGSGFNSEAKITGTENGKPFVSVFRTQAKRLGACPPQQPAPQQPAAPQKAPPKK